MPIKKIDPYRTRFKNASLCLEITVMVEKSENSSLFLFALKQSIDIFENKVLTAFV